MDTLSLSSWAKNNPTTKSFNCVLVFLHNWVENLYQYKNLNPYIQNRKRDRDVQNRILDSVGEVEGGMFRENSTEACILSMVKQITSPGWMHETSARAWYTGKTQRDRVEREVGGGIGIGNTCNSMADSCQCMTKPTTIL